MAETNAQTIKTPSNVITIIRILLVPVFVVAILSPWPEWLHIGGAQAWQPWAAAGIFILISGTDWLDGYLARKRNEVTDFGKFIDPIADKILVTAALLVLVELGSLPSWIVLIILARELIVSGVRMIAASRGEVIAASYLGKFKTVFQMIAIVLFVVKDSTIFQGQASVWLIVLAWVVMLIALALTVISMVDYLSKARHLIGFKPKGGIQIPEEEETVAEQVLGAAKAKGVMVGTAESCTGGLIAGTLTSIPGSSDSVAGGIISYSNDVKMACLGVLAETLDTHGAVSEQTACQMAEGARKQLAVDVAVSVTGIAGPGGEVPGKPVGTVWIGVSSKRGTRAELHHFDGDRDAVRSQTVDAALRMMLEEINAL
ncbi:CDP-diacylglycerol--glycerol-3-phosphate 3-phosphatidyltransferase [Slackia heliotrinireducens]|uniref:CDP-diacylglycerol--glycerol-3-phosphate 3-phosphatidyltransferase n=1 Tax=Slackia heliotrinireducens TaxID=84110 RepID=UPI003315E82F